VRELASLVREWQRSGERQKPHLGTVPPAQSV
jgi:hypothetical protein